MILFFDTETTGTFVKRASLMDERNPRLVSLGALGLSEDGNTECCSFYSVVRPDGFTIPEGASRVHGITTEFALQNGLEVGSVLKNFLRLFLAAKYVVAFNKVFDNQVIQRELNLQTDTSLSSLFNLDRTRCAMMAASGAMKRPNLHGYPGFAWPKLAEAYFWMFGQEPEKMHHAMNDVRATAFLTMGMLRLRYWDIETDAVLI